jgi:hypothetical protein
MLGITFLVLAFAQPTEGIENGKPEDRIFGNIGVFLDNSASMFLPDDGNRAFDKAQAIAQGIASGANKKSWFSLLTNDFDVRHTWTSAQAYKDQILEVPESDKSKTSESILGRLHHKFSSVEQGSSNQIVWISDFQKSQTGNPENWPLDSSIKYQLFPIEHKNNSNVWVDSVWLPGPLRAEKVENEIRVRVRNSGLESSRNLRIQMFEGTTLLAGKSIKIEKGNPSVISLPVRSGGRKIMSATIQVEDPEVPADNTFFFTLKLPKPIRIYALEPQKSDLLPRIFQESDLFKYQVGLTANPDYPQIEESELLVLNGGTNPGQALSNALLEQVKEGAGLIIIPDQNSNATFPFLEETGLKTELWNNPQNTKIELPEKGNLFFKDVFKEIGNQVIKPETTPRLKCQGGISHLKFESGEPFLSQIKFGKGNVFVLASPVSTSQGNLARHPIIIPLFYKMALMSSSSDFQTLFYRPDATKVKVNTDSLVQSGDIPAALEKAGKRILVQLQKLENGWAFDLPPQGIDPGFWEVKQGNKRLDVVAFNGHGKESEGEFHSFAQLQQAFSGKPWVQIRKVDADASQDFLKSEKNGDFPYWKWCICLAILMFAAEMLVLRFQSGKQALPL